MAFRLPFDRDLNDSVRQTAREELTEAIRLLRERAPGIRVVVLTTYADDRSVIDALQSGARGYLTKNADRREISQALHGAATGHTILPPEVAAIMHGVTALSVAW